MLELFSREETKKMLSDGTLSVWEVPKEEYGGIEINTNEGKNGIVRFIEERSCRTVLRTEIKHISKELVDKVEKEHEEAKLEFANLHDDIDF